MIFESPASRTEREWSEVEKRVASLLEHERGIRQVAALGAPLAEDVAAISAGTPRPSAKFACDGFKLTRLMEQSHAVVELRAAVISCRRREELATKAALLASHFSRLEDEALLDGDGGLPGIRTIGSRYQDRVDVKPSSIEKLVTGLSCGSPTDEYGLVLPPCRAPRDKKKRERLARVLGGAVVSSHALAEHEALLVRTSPPSLTVRVALEARLDVGERRGGHAVVRLSERLTWVAAPDPVIVHVCLA